MDGEVDGWRGTCVQYAKQGVLTMLSLHYMTKLYIQYVFVNLSLSLWWYSLKKTNLLKTHTKKQIKYQVTNVGVKSKTVTFASSMYYWIYEWNST